MFSKSKKFPSAELEEELNQVPLKINGHVPSWLSGTLIRNGPVEVCIDGKNQGHWLDGLAMLHAFYFNNGQLSYSNRFLKTDAYSQVFNKNSLDYPRFAIDPCRSLFKRFFTLFVPHSESYLQNANINIAKIANRYVALTEIPLPVEFDPKTLETLGAFRYTDPLPQKNIWESAHPHYLEKEKSFFNYYVEYGKTCYYVIYSLAENEPTRKIIGKIPVSHPSYMHSFSLTKNYVLFSEFPFRVKPLKMLMNTYLQGKAFIENFIWRPEDGTTFLLINRHTGKLIHKYQTEPFFAFHHVNAYETQEEIHLDLIAYDNPEIIQGIANHFSSKNPHINEDLFSTKLDRFQIPLDGSSVHRQTLFSNYIEFPRINEQRDGQHYRYVYLIDPRQETESTDIRPLYKIDTETKKILKWSEPNCYPGEPIFALAPYAKEEDEGVILSVVFNKKGENSFLLLLDAKTFQEIARAEVCHKIPIGLHGQYFPRSG